jgi:endonuclease/exonuclease/phosphatase family metal-dependent hydrolase
MRLVTFNILHGRSLEDGRVDVDRFRDAIRELDADILALQEVDRDQPRSFRSDLTAVAAEVMGAKSHRYAASLIGTPGERWVAATGDEQPGPPTYGIALLSRFPAHDWRTSRMPAIPVRVPMRLPVSRRLVIVREEPRLLLQARIDAPTGALTVATTHLSFVPGWNRLQLRRVARDVATVRGPLVLMGDLNMSARQAAAITGFRRLGTAATYPVDRPDRQLDHILLRGASPRVVHVRAARLPVSDHRALVVEVELG